MATDVEKVVLHVQIARNDLHEDDVQTALQALMKSLSACLIKMMSVQDGASVLEDTMKCVLTSSGLLVVTLLPVVVPDVLDCLQSWTLHQRAYSITVKGQRNDYVVESVFPLGFHAIADWKPLTTR